MIDHIFSPEVRVMSAQYSCRHIKWMIDEKERIELAPNFQRWQVWNNKQRSELIESILLGLPIPVIYLFESVYGLWQVLDGMQRLTTIVDFMSNHFRLSGLSVMPELNGCTYNDLERKLQGSIDDYNLMFYVIQPPTPEYVKYEIMRRVNKGGTALNGQEMREMLYNGRATDLLDELRVMPEFCEASQCISSRRKKDSYLVLRCIAFNLCVQQNSWNDSAFMEFWNGRGDVNELLARCMIYINQKASDYEIDMCRKYLRASMCNGLKIGGNNAFFFENMRYSWRPIINSPLFELLFAIYADDIVNSNSDKVRHIIHELRSGNKYSMLFRGRNVDSHSVLMDRIGLANTIIRRLKND